MTASKRSVLQIVRIMFCVTVLALAFAPLAHVQPEPAKVSTERRVGLETVTFDTLNGRVVVNVPDDMMAGDTISGTVIAEPKGQTAEEKEKNLAELSGYVIELKPPEGAKQQGATKVPLSGLGSSEIRYRLYLPSFASKNQPASKQRELKVSLNEAKQGTTEPSDFAVPVGTIIIATNDFAPPTGSIVTSSNKFRLPTIAQQGRPVEITGPFDGSFENTKVLVGGEEVSILAESPRKAVFQSPLDTTGVAEIIVQEGTTETKGEFRNLRLRLTAPKTTLAKGESTTLTVKVSGLEGITQDVPLHLENAAPAVVTIEGGDKQTLRITPASLQPDGSFSTTRSITGQQTGAYSATATVVILNHCLQDDKNPARVILWNSFTGDYNFCAGPASARGSNPISLTTMDFSGGVFLATAGPGDLTKPGALTLRGDNEDRRLLINLDASLPPSGSATIQLLKSKQTFTISDRDTRNNTCICN